jgi:K319L-like, PKD domain
MGLRLSVLLSFSIILLSSTTYGSSSVHAQLTNSSSVAIPMTPSINIVQIKQQEEQQINNKSSSSSSFVFASPSPNLINPLSIMSTASSSSLGGNYPNSQLPIANAGHNQTVTAGSTVILNASNSKSPNGIILGYSWKQIPTGSINLGAVNSPVWDFTAPRVATNTLLQFQLNVTDNWGQTGTSFVNVLDKPAMAIHALSLSSSLPQVKSPATTVTKTVTSNNQIKARNYLVNIPTNYNTQKSPSPQKRQQQLIQQPPLIPPISNAR